MQTPLAMRVQTPSLLSPTQQYIITVLVMEDISLTGLGGLLVIDTEVGEGTTAWERKDIH